MPYVCWGEDGEDLTAAVRAKVKARSTTVFQLARAAGARRRRKRPSKATVVVKCREGHKNKFVVDYDTFG